MAVGGEGMEEREVGEEEVREVEEVEECHLERACISEMAMKRAVRRGFMYWSKIYAMKEKEKEK
tara:strand:+ start:314 stop:505 length:192 start_codon:yes stop_codon:yes gene_type:complete